VRAPLPARLLLAAALAAGGAAPALAQDAPAPVPVTGTQDAAGPRGNGDREQRLRRARERWEAMTPGERDEVRRRFEKWKGMAPEEREALRRRLEDLGGRRGAEDARRRLRDLKASDPEHHQRLRVQVAVLGGIWRRFLERLPPEQRARWDALPAETQDRVRAQVLRRFAAAAREIAMETLATPEERAALSSGDEAVRRATMERIRLRFRDAALGPHRAELEALPPEERRVREVRLLEEHRLSFLEDSLPERLPRLREAFLRALREPGARDRRAGFEAAFGVDAEDLGSPRAARRLGIALAARPPADRDEFLGAVRPELRRIVALPATEREAAVHALLDRMR
jgi:hypothetical protein